MIKLYNSLTHTKEEFIPVKDDNKIRMYTCGMTVQDEPHIGHIRSAITADIIRRTLQLAGYEIISLYNFTDIDDKLIEKMNNSGVDYRTIAQKNIDEFLKYAKIMNIMPFTFYPRATNHIEEILDLIKTLIDKGYAYNKNGNVYFRVDKDKEYGKLSGKRIEDLIKGKRVEISEEKENPLDFALWKKAKEGEPFWYSPFGNGRPGWHIECSAMSMKYLGETFDIHTGGEDLIFPHHENEIAQSECATGKIFAKYWLHNGMLNLKGEKMSKSIGNVFKISELLKKYNPNVIRLYLYKTHYRKMIEFSSERLDEAKNAYMRILNALEGNYEEILNNEYIEKFKNTLYDDFNTPEALSVVFDIVNKINKNENTKQLRFTLRHILELMGFTKIEKSKDSQSIENIMNILIEIRNIARKQKNFEIADLIRDKLKENNIVLQDTKDGTTWKIED